VWLTTALATYYTTTTGGNTATNYLGTANVDVTSSPTLNGALTINSLRFNQLAADTVTLTGTNVINSGGILVTSTVANNLSTLTGGTLKGASGKDLVVIQNNTSNSLVIASVIADNTNAMALTKSGAGTLILTGANIYTGLTYVNAGTLQIGNGLTTGQLGSTAAVVNNGTLSFNRSDAITINNIISGNGGLTQAGAGTTTLGSANSYMGVTTVSGGVLLLNNASALPGGIGNGGGTSGLTLNGGVLGLGTGDFSRALGTGTDQVQWTGSGGFAAYGAPRNVNPAAARPLSGTARAVS